MKGISFFLYSPHILGLQSISQDVADNVSHPRQLDPTMELMTYSFVLYLQHGRHDAKCKPSISLRDIKSASRLECIQLSQYLYIGVTERYKS